MRRLAGCVLALGLVLAASSVGSASAERGFRTASGSGDAFAPSQVVERLAGTVSSQQYGERITWRLAWSGPAQRYRSFERISGYDDTTIIYGSRGTEYMGPGDRAGTTLTSGAKTVRMMPAEPDGLSSLDWQLLEGVGAALARHRSGKAPMTLETRNGRSVWHSTTTIPANECSGAKRGTLHLWLDAANLLPVAMRIDRAKVSQSVRREIEYSVLNGDLGEEIAQPVLRGQFQRMDDGFRRTGPKRAATHLPFVPRMPTALPSGFALMATGWAPRGRSIGPEAFLPRSPGLFAATWRRGFEHVDITQRPARPAMLRRYWLSTDPFGGECMPSYTQRLRINGSPARFATSPMETPRLWWRKGEVLYTVSGPFSRAELARIARSLRPVA